MSCSRAKPFLLEEILPRFCMSVSDEHYLSHGKKCEMVLSFRIFAQGDANMADGAGLARLFSWKRPRSWAYIQLPRRVDSLSAIIQVWVALPLCLERLYTFL